jgi:vacuolar-type H+-ATPase subunit E/Vma4
MIRTAEAEAERILADADEAIRTRQRDVLRSREQKWRAEARVRIAAARHEAMKDVLLSRTRVVNRVLDAARALLPAILKTEQYDSLLAHEIEQALDFVGDGGATVHCTQSLASAVRRSVASKPSVAVEPSDDIGSGFVAADDGGTVRVDCTLEARLDRLAPLLAIEIHRRLAEIEP